MPALLHRRAPLGLYPAGETAEHFPSKLFSAKTDLHQHRKQLISWGRVEISESH